MSAPAILVERDGRVATVRIDRPERRNALRPEDVALLTDALTALDREGAARAVVLGGTGGWLCAGGDLSDGQTADGPVASDAMVGGFQRLLRVLLEVSVPVVVVLEGAAVGAGAALALAADVCVAAPTAKISLPWIARGLVPDMGVAYLLTTRLGPMTAKRLLLGGGSLPAADALAAGLVTEVADEPWAPARAWADRLAAGPRYATTLTKRLVNAAAYGGLDAYLAVERSSMAAVLGTDEPSEGIRAFDERRPPVFP
jgi:2-(1,2-epoxy-1,2-dihydrophenyl)acetyl-CoA isomerase